ncbi:MAG: cytochrome c biogenesis protein CcdA [Gemmatimonadetes bacterium]|nr:cytochrome c biogenesis protein CcdA [Gemmatimonadota bacterium]
MTGVPVLAAAAAGVVSFLSPCVLPLLPGYLSFVSGISYAELAGEKDEPGRRAALVRTVTPNAVLFVLGFTTVFVALGASATTLGRFLIGSFPTFTRIAGAVIILFGLHIVGVVRIPVLHREKRVQTKAAPRTLVGSYTVGMAFAFGWTPCIGPILAAMLTLAATRETVSQGVALLTVYSLGLGVPFLVAALGVNYVLGFMSRFRRYVRGVEIAGGVLLVLVGVLVFANKLTWLSQQLWFLNRFAL